MAKQIKNLPKHMQYAYGAQPSPLAGAQLIFMNELIEVLEEFKAVAKESNGEDLVPAIAGLSAQFRQGLAELAAAIAKNKPKAQSLAPITKGLKVLAERPLSVRQEQIEALAANLEQLAETDAAVLAELRRMAKPKKWKFDITRDSLHGHIVDVTATPVEAD